MIRVYRYGLRAPKQNGPLVREQMRAAHEYRNDLVQIERGRRWAVRQMHETSEVAEALDALRGAAKSDRRAALSALNKARRESEDPDTMALIKEREGELRRGARSLTTAYWGTYLGIESAHDQARKAPLYGDDGVKPSDPRFVRWHGLGPSEVGEWRGDGQVGVQIQSSRALTTADAKAGSDTRVRWLAHRGGYALWLRVGSEGRDPVWAMWPVYRDREMPDAAVWKWVRVSCRREGTREQWSCEITLDTMAEHPHALDASLDGAIAVELGWWPQDDGSLLVASWEDSRGESGRVWLPASIVTGIRKPDGIRSLRDMHRNELREALSRHIRESKDAVPAWLRQASATMQLWIAQERFHRLWREWMTRKENACRDGFELLDAWHVRDDHLHDYEAGARREALRERREMYRVLAAKWAREYRTVLLPDRDLSREARWGEDSDRRFTASPQELAMSLKNAFGDECRRVVWEGPHGVLSEADDAPTWLERAIEQWRAGEIVGRARKRRKSTDHLEKGGAWAARKARKLDKLATDTEGARNASHKAAE